MAILESRTKHSTCKQTVSNQRIIKKISGGKCCPVSLLVSEMTAPIDISSYCSCSVMTSSTRSHSQYRKGQIEKCKRERDGNILYLLWCKCMTSDNIPLQSLCYMQVDTESPQISAESKHSSFCKTITS